MSIAILMLFALSSTVAALDCSSDTIACANDGRCISLTYLCDRDTDCSDSSDENEQLCAEWINDACSRNEVKCKKDSNSECVSIYNYCNSENPPCQGDLDPRICKMMKSGKLEDLDTIIVETVLPDNLNKSFELAEKFRTLVPHSLSHDACPSLFTLVGDQCLSIFHIGSMSWGESREFCKLMRGDLITFRNVSHYTAVVQHLQQHEISSNFWIGGHLADKNEGWIWVDETPMELGSPYWATRYSKTCVERNVTVAADEELCFQYYQAPEKTVKGRCVGLSFEHFFFMSDEDCVKKMSPLCVYMESEPLHSLRQLVNVRGAF